MRMMTKLSALLAVLLLALTLGRTGVAAQDGPVPAPFEVGDLEGIQSAVSRTYTVDFESLIGTPGADAGIPELSGVVTMIGVIGQFDSSDNAAAAVERVDEEATSALVEEDNVPELTEAEVDLGETSRAYTATQDVEGQTLNLSVIIVQQDEYMYFVVAGVVDGDAQQLATDFTQTLIDGEAGEGEPQVNADGTSTGGLWDKFPKADDALVANLVAFDEQLYPEVESTPAP